MKTLFIIMFLFAGLTAAQVRHFEFGPERSVGHSAAVKGSDTYNRERGYGFEPNSQVMCWQGTTKSNGNCTSEKPFYFSVAVPEGNYRVTIRFGDRQVATSNVVKAELRRLMLERVIRNRGSSYHDPSL